MSDLKAKQTNMECSLIQELMLYKFKLSYDTVEATKNVCYAKDEGTVDPSTMTRWFKIFQLGCKNLNNQARWSRSKTMDSEAVPQAIEVNLASSTQRVSGKLIISQSNVVCNLHDLSKSMQICQILPHITKIFQNFWLILVC